MHIIIQSSSVETALFEKINQNNLQTKFEEKKNWKVIKENPKWKKQGLGEDDNGDDKCSQKQNF